MANVHVINLAVKKNDCRPVAGGAGAGSSGSEQARNTTESGWNEKLGFRRTK